jgi:hypothetical protein
MISSICTTFESAPAFSHGIAEFTLKNPLPTDPRVLVLKARSQGCSGRSVTQAITRHAAEKRSAERA